VIIRPGDIILGDADGVVVIPPESAEQCLDLCEKRFTIDEETLKCLKGGEPMGTTIARLRPGVQ
jgi:regulator of RNase E activity RraA